MKTLFDELFNPWQTSKSSSVVEDRGDVYSFEYELAGFSKKDVSVKASDDLLTIEAKRENKTKSFKIHLNGLVSINDIKCNMKDGLLLLTMPKKAVLDSVQIKID